MTTPLKPNYGPFPSARAVAYIRKQAVRQMTDTVTVYRPAQPVFNNATGQMTATKSTVIYTGVARVEGSRGPAVQQDGNALLVFRQFVVTIPFDLNPSAHADDEVQILVNDDQLLIGKTLRIIDVSTGGSLSASTSLTCVGIESSAFTA